MGDFSPVRIDIRTQADVIHCRRAARKQAVRLAFGLADQTRLATAVSELARNALQHGGGGICLIQPCRNVGAQGIAVIIEDVGPGIADIGQAMQSGFSTDRSLGMGLPAARRLAHDFDMESRPGKTVVRIEMYVKS